MSEFEKTRTREREQGAMTPYDIFIRSRLEFLERQNTGQVVVNRGYLYNNPALYQDFLYPGPQREAFKRLLDQRVLIPYLFNESSPADEARFTSRASLAPTAPTRQRAARLCTRLPTATSRCLSSTRTWRPSSIRSSGSACSAATRRRCLRRAPTLEV